MALVVQVDLASTDLVDLAVLRVDPAGPVGLVDRDTPADTVRVVPAAQVDRAALGTATTNAATSVAPRGATGLALGVWSASSSGLGSTAAAARRPVELRPDQLLRLPGDAHLESRF